MTITLLTPSRQRIDSWSATHVGLKREGNEDAYRCTPARGLFVIADGIGGHPGGEFASSIAVEACHESLIRSQELPGPAMKRAFSYANQRVLEAASKNPALFRMGTTLVAAMLYRGEFVVAHCGDSRVYLIRQGALVLLTQDHGYGGVLTSCIGDEFKAKCETRILPVQSGDRLLLCTDGLSSYVSESVIAHTFRNHREPKPCATALIQEALKVGGMDNITVAIVRVR